MNRVSALLRVVFSPLVVVTLLCFGLAGGCATQPNPSRMSPQQRLIYELALAQGVTDFDRVERIDFTFNVQAGENTNSRSWSWRPKTNLVTFDNQFTYHRDQLYGQVDEKVLEADKKFINDSFWLLMPLHLEWSSDVTVAEGEAVIPPIGHEPLRRVTVTYSASGGGYTPGDVYHLYMDESGVVHEWSFHRGGAVEPSLICSWEGYRQVGPLRLALDHVNKKTGFRLWFTDVTVHTKDGQTFAAAGP